MLVSSREIPYTTPTVVSYWMIKFMRDLQGENNNADTNYLEKYYVNFLVGSRQKLTEE